MLNYVADFAFNRYSVAILLTLAKNLNLKKAIMERGGAFLKNTEGAIDTLKELGLTTVQAKTYLALVKTDKSTIKEIATLSQVPRTDLYRSIQELENRGLVDRILSKPTQFRAIPIDECIELLYRKIAKKNMELKKKTFKLRIRLKNGKNHGSSELNSSEYLLVPKSRAIEKIRKAIHATEATLDVVSSWERFSSATFTFAHELENAWSRGVKCRFVIEKPASSEALANVLAPHQKNRQCRFRFTPTSPQTVVSIYDGKEVVIIEKPTASLKESSILWSNNKSLISMAQEFFEIHWITGKEDPYFQTDVRIGHDKRPQRLKDHQALSLR
jgi:sugar-specific transcriptional regulator TrmB